MLRGARHSPSILYFILSPELLLLVLIADVGVGSPLTATRANDGTDEAPVVEDPLLGATLGGLLLLGGLHLGRLTLDLTGTRKTSVNLT